MQNKNKTITIAVMAIYAALYAVLVNVFPGLSFGPLQFRVADILIAVVPLLGIPGVLGHTLGVIIGNMSSPYIPIDLLNAIPSFIMAFIVYYIYKRTKKDITVIGTCITYSIVLGITVGWMISFIEGLPLIGTIAYVALSNTIASVLIGWPVFKCLKKIGIFKKWFGE
ncbi:MAG: QueT transporter family protein [Nitrososphaerota archaeon]|jgi:uncharacterized membrane protein|nr:QueT transporter family protein [Nitrososphaerota archaeon]